MRRLFPLILIIASLTRSGMAQAAQFPNATCPDSVRIAQLQDVTALCAPAVNDTVAGVGGIIIGFDPIATGFDIYMQNSQGGPFSGINMFTGFINTKVAPYNFALGDSIVVEYAKKGEFQNNTQMLAPNGSNVSPNWIIRKVSSGHALPPFFVGTTTQLRETPTNTFAEQYEGGLVKINGPLTVVRTSLTGGMGTANSFLVIDPGAPADSVFIEGNKLTTNAPPAVGTVIGRRFADGIGCTLLHSEHHPHRIRQRRHSVQRHAPVQLHSGLWQRHCGSSGRWPSGGPAYGHEPSVGRTSRNIDRQ
jgi:hypothetical protein